MFQMMKQAGSMQREMKRMQKELRRLQVEASGAGGAVKVSVGGDMSIRALSIDPQSLKEWSPAQLERAIVSAVNDGLEQAKKMAGREMSKLTEGMGLSGLLGS